MLSRSSCSDRQRVNSRLHQVAERRIDHPLPLHTALPHEGRAFDPQREVAFAGGVVAAVAAMLFAVVDQFDAARRKRRAEAGKHFRRDRTGFSSVHGAYIVGFDGNEAITTAWAGGGSAGEVRRSRL